MVILPEELKRKNEIVESYRVNGKIRSDAPSYVFEYDKEIQAFYLEWYSTDLM